MTKKTFIAIAAGFRARATVKPADFNASPETARAVLFETFNCAKMFADIAAQSDPNFDRQRFLSACGLGDEKLMGGTAQ